MVEASRSAARIGTGPTVTGWDALLHTDRNSSGEALSAPVEQKPKRATDSKIFLLGERGES